MATIQGVIDSSIARYMDAAKTLWSDVELLANANKAVDYINQLLISRSNPLSIKSGSVALIDGTETYTFAGAGMSDFLAVYEGTKIDNSGVSIIDSRLESMKESDRTDFINDDGTMDEQEPTNFYIGTTYIGFLPVPDTAYTATVWYYFQPVALILTTEMPWSGIFNEAISSFMTNMALVRAEYNSTPLLEVYNELESKAMLVATKRTATRIRMRNGR
jgi:hypothetical protein